MTKIESLALAISKTCGAFNPDSEAFKLNNPGLLRAFSQKHKEDSFNGYRVFPSWQAGLKALCFDLALKCAGESRARVKSHNSLVDLLKMWDIKETRKTLSFLRRAIGDETISETTKLEYFNA